MTTLVSDARLNGTVVKLMADKGFGFIQGDDLKEYFFHRSSVRKGGWAMISVNQTVSFIPRLPDKGPRAEDVEVLV